MVKLEQQIPHQILTEIPGPIAPCEILSMSENHVANPLRHTVWRRLIHYQQMQQPPGCRNST